MHFFKCILLVLNFTAVSPLLSQDKIKFYEDRSLMRGEMLKHIPVGSDTAYARTVLSKNDMIGLKWMYDSEFMGGTSHYAHIDFLYARYEKHYIFVTARWQFAIVQDKGKVKDVIVSFGTIGL